ncbi:hypothetical protein [Candidatus Nitrosocosmicus arcticus]|uniref:Uncharacterized protein n=1 Tax=Candidatus Nitrosocosmicus arcticus TaxID=2035267 RepID=A0A557SYA3_9ARCH|nr:hypothetical protein [Candidatus Nitrosocosmicus arcticus]TVP41586.1 exported protein of unknown function [Candidatus Nitrosocosmicus arcticus]
MHKKPFKNTIVLASITLLLLVSLSLSPHPISYAFLGFDLGGSSSSSTDQSLGSSQRSMQGAQCYSPNASIIDSCNSGDGSTSENLGHNLYGQ